MVSVMFELCVYCGTERTSGCRYNCRELWPQRLKRREKQRRRYRNFYRVSSFYGPSSSSYYFILFLHFYFILFFLMFCRVLCVLCFYVYTVIWAELPEINLMMMMMMMMMIRYSGTSINTCMQPLMQRGRYSYLFLASFYYLVH